VLARRSRILRLPRVIARPYGTVASKGQLYERRLLSALGPLGRDPPLCPPLRRVERLADVDRLAHDPAVPDFENVDRVARFTDVIADGHLATQISSAPSDATNVIAHRSRIAAAPPSDVDNTPRIAHLTGGTRAPRRRRTCHASQRDHPLPPQGSATTSPLPFPDPCRTGCPVCSRSRHLAHKCRSAARYDDAAAIPDSGLRSARERWRNVQTR
jgi:hypothetical protein